MSPLGYPLMSTKNVSPYGPAVWPAMGTYIGMSGVIIQINTYESIIIIFK